jgi:hypothetical protein
MCNIHRTEAAAALKYSSIQSAAYSRLTGKRNTLWPARCRSPKSFPQKTNRRLGSDRNNATITVFSNNVVTDDFTARFIMALIGKDVVLAAELVGGADAARRGG